MPQLDRSNLSSLTVYVGEKDYHLRQQLREMFVAEGIKNVSTHSSVESLRALMDEVPCDLLMMSDEFDNDVFNIIREVRFSQLGVNPFIVISMLVNQNRPNSIQKAIDAGADDVVIKPVDAKRIHERLRLIAYYRQPFVATSEYVGPDRKSEQPIHAGARRVHVLNTVREKADGRKFEQWELQEAIDISRGRVVEAQLTSQSMKMGAICDVILDAYRSGLVTEDVRDHLAILTSILKEAGSMARSIKDTSLESLCLSLAENVSSMEYKYEELADADVELIEKLSQAFRMAIDSAAQRKMDEEAEEASRYEGRIAGQAVDL